MECLVVALETAKKLKAAGFPQYQTVSYWVPQSGISERVSSYMLAGLPVGERGFAAPTAQEIADQLPEREVEPYTITMGAGWYTAINDRPPESEIRGDGGTMAEALAALWLKLHEVRS
jgi:hypothetical protein